MKKLLLPFFIAGIFALVACSEGADDPLEIIGGDSSSSSSIGISSNSSGVSSSSGVNAGGGSSDSNSSSSDGDSGDSSSSISSSSDASSSSSSLGEPVWVGNPSVIFNEITAANISLKDEYGNEPGWVELYNTTSSTVNLSGYVLTNNANTAAWTFGRVVVPSKGYLVVFLSGKNQPDLSADKNIHASFELNATGGKLFLIDAQRGIRDSIAYPAATIRGLSYSKHPDNGSWAFSAPTPNAVNSREIYTEQAKPPELPKSGYYTEALNITIPNETSEGIVFCERNGAVPTRNSTIRSGSTVNITSTTILRCAQFKDGAYPSDQIMRTYIVGRLPNLPIISIAVNPDSMFNNSRALYKSSHQSGCNASVTYYMADTTLPIFVEMFEPGKAAQKNGPEWSHQAELKLHGGCSRQFPKKSVIISFREKYGQKNLRYPLFPDYPNLTKFKHFMLRNNGNNFPHDYMRDMLMTSLTEGLDVDYQKGRAVVVYYNGSYYGIHNLRERANSDYFETNYNYDEEYIDLINVDKDEVSKGSDADYQDIARWLNGISMLTDQDLKELETRIDLNNFTNHFQSRIFYIDGDWPGKNMKRWRSNMPRTKWRWFMYDTDHGFGSWGVDNICYSDRLCSNRMMQHVTMQGGLIWSNEKPAATLILRKLLTNESYKIAFINRFSLLIATYFTSARISAKIDALMAPIQSEIQYDQERWGSKEGRTLSTIRSFGNDRPASMQSELENFFGTSSGGYGLGYSLGTSANLTLSVSGNGKVSVHGLPVPNNNATFKVYSNVPVTIKAEGAGFKGWSDGNANAERTEYIIQTTTLQANF
jgi:hypothetical protein